MYSKESKKFQQHLKEILDLLDLSGADFGKRVGLTRAAISAIASGKAPLTQTNYIAFRMYLEQYASRKRPIVNLFIKLVMGEIITEFINSDDIDAIPAMAYGLILAKKDDYLVNILKSKKIVLGDLKAKDFAVTEVYWLQKIIKG